MKKKPAALILSLTFVIGLCMVNLWRFYSDSVYSGLNVKLAVILILLILACWSYNLWPKISLVVIALICFVGSILMTFSFASLIEQFEVYDFELGVPDNTEFILISTCFSLVTLGSAFLSSVISIFRVYPNKKLHNNQIKLKSDNLN